MKWIANIDVHDASANESVCYGLFPIVADNEREAAKSAAVAVANLLFQKEQATTGFVNQIDEHKYRVAIGIYQGKGLTQGRTLTIAVSEYRGEQ